MKKLSVLAAGLLSASLASAVVPTPIDCNLFFDGTNTLHIAWNATPGSSYVLQTTTNLAQPWQTVAPPGTVVATRNQVWQAMPVDTSTRFFRVLRFDSEGPEIQPVSPLDGAIAVRQQDVLQAWLRDETGINAGTISLAIGTNTPVTLNDPRLNFADGLLTYTPAGNDLHGPLGSSVTVRVSAADALGNQTTNFTWSFQVALPTVPVTNILYIPGASGFVLAATNGDYFSYSYPGAFPGMTNGLHLVNTNANTGYTRTIIAFTNYPASNTVVVFTRPTKLGELLELGSLSGANFTETGARPASPMTGAFGLKGAKNLHDVSAQDFGLTRTINLDGVLYQDANLLIELLPGSELALDAALDFSANFSGLRLRQFAASFTGSADFQLDAHVHANGALTRSGEIPVMDPVRKRFYAVIPTPLGPLPAWVELVLEINAGYDLDLVAAADYTAGLRGNKEFFASRRWSVTEGWTRVWQNPAAGFTFLGPQWQLETSGRVRVYLQPKLTLYAYSAVGISADLQPYLDLEGDAQFNPPAWGLALYGGLTSTIGVELRVWDDSWGDLPDEKFELIPRTRLWEHSTEATPPQITSQPSDQWVAVGRIATFTVQASGSAPLNYRWQKNWLWLAEDARITGTRSSSLRIANARTSDAGRYRVVVSNPNGAATSQAAVLAITAPSSMALIPAGNFTMGDSLNDYPGSSEHPVHTVYVSAFYMDRTEVTKALWDEVYQWAINRPVDVRYSFDFSNSGQGKAANHPAHKMTWHDAVKWCNARSEREGRVPAYYTSAAQTTVYRSGQLSVQNDRVKWNGGYRLPTEAEWEKAARGGASGKRFPWGNTITHSQANYSSSSSYTYDVSPTRNYHPTYNTGVMPYTSPVGSFAPNGYGLYDMAGNVWEWCWDWWSGSYYSSSPSSDPRGPTPGSYRVIRGGSLNRDAFSCRAAYRDYNGFPTIRSSNFGFRSVLPPGQ